MGGKPWAGAGGGMVIPEKGQAGACAGSTAGAVSGCVLREKSASSPSFEVVGLSLVRWGVGAGSGELGCLSFLLVLVVSERWGDSTSREERSKSEINCCCVGTSQSPLIGDSSCAEEAAISLWTSWISLEAEGGRSGMAGCSGNVASPFVSDDCPSHNNLSEALSASTSKSELGREPKISSVRTCSVSDGSCGGRGASGLASFSDGARPDVSALCSCAGCVSGASLGVEVVGAVRPSNSVGL